MNLLLDEIARATARLADLVRRLKEEVTLVIIEHNMRFLFDLADTVAVIQWGQVIARGTPGFSGADLANLVNEAALLAARASKRLVTMQDFEAAKDKVLMGAERRSMVMTDEEKTVTAYHEGGHALVGLYEPHHDPLHKVTIIPRGRALGVTMSLPEKDRYGYSKAELSAKLAMMFGGRVAEELRVEDVVPGPAGNRAQALDPDGRLVDDFRISTIGRVLALRNAPSPAATSALAIAEHVVASVLERVA